MANVEHVEYEVRVRKWFHVALSEKEGQALVGHIRGTTQYGLLVPYNQLPEAAKVIVRGEFDRVSADEGVQP